MRVKAFLNACFKHKIAGVLQSMMPTLIIVPVRRRLETPSDHDILQLVQIFVEHYGQRIGKLSIFAVH
jgi:hypothetical protein